MKIKRKPESSAGVWLILMIAFIVQVASLVSDGIGYICLTETRTLPSEIMGDKCVKATLAEKEFRVPLQTPVFLDGEETDGYLLPFLGIEKFQPTLGMGNTKNPTLLQARSERGLSQLLDYSLTRFKTFDEPIPTTALLVLAGLVAIIALRRRRK